MTTAATATRPATVPALVSPARRGRLLAPTEPGGQPVANVQQPFTWQGHRAIAPNLYDFRARVWSADLGAFLQPDEYVFLSHGGTLWSWPGQNPAVLNHELAHVKQHDVLGPVYLPLHVLAQLYSQLTTGTYQKANPLEHGPYKKPPCPF
jgi:hypothetical protein